MNKATIARLISIAAHPFIMIVLLVLVLSWAMDPAGALRITGFVVAVGLIPTGWLLWRHLHRQRNPAGHGSTSSTRPVLYLTILAVLLLSSIYFHFVEHSAFLVRGALVTAIMVAVAAVLNRWLKLSLHLTFAVYGGLIIARVNPVLGLTILLLVPLLAWSRLVLLRHTVAEVIGGAVLGFGSALALICLWHHA